MPRFALALDVQRDLFDTGRLSVETGLESQRELTGSVLDEIDSHPRD